MPEIKSGGMVYTVPDAMVFEGEEVEISPSDLVEVYGDHYQEGDEPIGIDLRMELPNHGTVIFGICSDGWHGVSVTAGPLDGNDSAVDTLPEPPASFVEQVYIAPADDDFDEQDEDEEEEE